MMKNQETDIKILNTSWKTSETGPSFADAANSCLTFSIPLMIACISSANDFNCIWKKWCTQSIHIVILLPKKQVVKSFHLNSFFFHLKM